MISVALFNNKGGVGKTTLAYHLAHMLCRLGHRVIAVDLDPQSNLTAEFLDEAQVEAVWRYPDSVKLASPADEHGESRTIAAAVKPIMDGVGDIRPCEPVQVAGDLWLLAGDLTLSAFEDRLSAAWARGFTGEDVAALRTTTAFHRILKAAGERVSAEIAVIDVGPNLGAINRAGLLAADTVLVPLAADLFSLRGLENLGPTLRGWRRTWQRKVLPDLPSGIDAPAGRMTPLGYVIMQPAMRLDRPVQAYQRWVDRIPRVYATSVLDRPASVPVDSSYEVATLRNYQSLMPLSHDARKPMFDLRSADGALGSTQKLVQRCYLDFRNLSRELLRRLEAVVGEG